MLTNTAVYQPVDERVPPVLRLAMAPGRAAARHGDHVGVPRDHARDRPPAPRPGRRRRLPRAVPVRRPARRDRRVRRRHPGHRGPPEPARARAHRRRRHAGSTSPRCCSGARATRCSPRGTCATCVTRLPQADVHRFEGAGHLVVEDRDVAGGVLRWLDARGLGRGRSPEPRPDRARRAVPPARGGARRAVRRRRHRDRRARRRTRGVRRWRALAARTDELARGLSALRRPAGRPCRAARAARCRPDGRSCTPACAWVPWSSSRTPVSACRASRAPCAPPSRSVVIGIERALVAARWLRWAPTLISAGPLRPGVRRALGVRGVARRGRRARPVVGGGAAVARARRGRGDPVHLRLDRAGQGRRVHAPPARGDAGRGRRDVRHRSGQPAGRRVRAVRAARAGARRDERRARTWTSRRPAR